MHTTLLMLPARELMSRFWCLYHEDVIRGLQEKKSEDLLRERLRRDKAANIIKRTVRNYGLAVRRGMGFSIRRLSECSSLSLAHVDVSVFDVL